MKPHVLAVFLVLGLAMAGLAPPASAEHATYQIDLDTDLPEDDFVVYKGGHLSLSFRPNYDSYVMLLALDKKGNVRVLFPNKWQPDNFVREGEDVTVEPIYADYAGPVYVEAVAVASDYFAYRYGERRNPFWNEARWGDFDPYDSVLSDRRGSFTVSFDDAISRRPPSVPARLDRDALDRELRDLIDDDYATFERAVRDFRDEIYEIVGGETWTSSYADVYVADAKFDPALSTGEGPSESYESPTYASYYDYEPEQFDYEVALSGYGTWMDMRGVRVWRPPVFGVGWRPYMHGYWTWTTYGWYWVGYEPFAWVTYHWGNWNYDPFYGWYWIPDWWHYRFVPANCSWYWYDEYVAWYPTPPPAFVAATLHINVSAQVDLAHAVVVSKKNFLHGNISAVAEPAQRVTSVLRHAKAKFEPDKAPKPEVIARAAGRAITATPIKTVQKTTAKGEKVSIIKPVETREPPKVFQDMDRKARAEVLSKKPVAKAPATGEKARPGLPAPAKRPAPVAPPAAVKERPRREPPAIPAPRVTPSPRPKTPAVEPREEHEAPAPAPRTAPKQERTPPAAHPAPTPPPARKTPKSAEPPPSEHRKPPKAEPASREQRKPPHVKPAPAPSPKAEPPSAPPPKVEPEKSPKKEPKGKPAPEEHDDEDGKGKKDKAPHAGH